MSRDTSIVPVLMFHSVGLERHPWAWSHISESVESFESKIALFRRNGFNAVTWDELFQHMSGERVLPDNSILLTFDDGYLDNWVYVYPILKKYGMKGTVFVSTDFVDPSEAARPNMDDVLAGRANADDVVVPGFLNWAEMEQMERSGVIDIQSHAASHTWYFSGPGVVDLHRHHDVTPNPWLFWNAAPRRKPMYLSEDQQQELPIGYPILEHQKSLVVRRFQPDESAMNEIVEYVAEQGGPTFFDQPDWRNAIDRHLRETFSDGEIPGNYESDDERRDRIRIELEGSKQRIEAHLNKRVDYICWPGGGNDTQVHELARDIGYRSWTLSSQSSLEKRNRTGADPGSIKRIGTTNRILVKGRDCGAAGARYQLWRIFDHQGSALHSILVKSLKLFALLISMGGKKQ